MASGEHRSTGLAKLCKGVIEITRRSKPESRFNRLFKEKEGIQEYG
jgi:hypothetical protein